LEDLTSYDIKRLIWLREKDKLGFSIAIGVAIGAAIGSATGYTSQGIALGIALGVVFGIIWMKKSKQGNEKCKDS